MWKDPQKELPIIHSVFWDGDPVLESRPVLTRTMNEDPDNGGSSDGYHYEVAFYSVLHLEDAVGIWTSLADLEPMDEPDAWMDLPRDCPDVEQG